MVTLRLKLLGGFKATLESGDELTIKGRKTQGLLAILALSAGQAVTRDKLANLLWGDRGDEQARGSLRQALLNCAAHWETIPILSAPNVITSL